MHIDEIRAYWDDQAAGFDDEPDHGLADPAVADAWRELLVEHLPNAPARVADLGSGTGTLAVLLADLGYDVDGVDLSPRMVARATEKASALDPRPRFTVGDAASPPLPAATYDVVLVRHVTWTLPDPDAALREWHGLLRPTGRLLLVEGFWGTGAGLHARDLEAMVAGVFDRVDVQPLREPRYWGRAITDERYLLTACPRSH